MKFNKIGCQFCFAHYLQTLRIRSLRIQTTLWDCTIQTVDIQVGHPRDNLLPPVDPLFSLVSYLWLAVRLHCFKILLSELIFSRWTRSEIPSGAFWQSDRWREQDIRVWRCRLRLPHAQNISLLLWGLQQRAWCRTHLHCRGTQSELHHEGPQVAHQTLRVQSQKPNQPNWKCSVNCGRTMLVV